MADERSETQTSLGPKQKLHWMFEDSFSGCWSAVRFDKNDNEIPVCHIEVETSDLNESGKFVVWVKQRGHEGMVRPQRGPLKDAFDCLCSAMKACEAYYA